MRPLSISAAVLATALAGASASALPVVPGFVVEEYATGVTDPVRLSFDPSGVLYVGRDLSSPRKIHRIGPGGSPVELYGTIGLPDPDAVLFDTNGAVSGTPGSVLVGGGSGLTAQGQISAILPDQSVVTVFGPIPSFRNPTDMHFDNNGRLIFSDFHGQQVLVADGGVPTTLFTLPTSPRTIAIDAANRIYVSSEDGTIRIHDSDGSAIDSDFVTGLGAGVVIALGQGDSLWGTDLYAVTRGELLRFDSAGNPTTIGTGFGKTWDLEFGPDGALYLSDYDNDRILRIVPEPTTGLMLLIPLLGLKRRRVS